MHIALWLQFNTPLKWNLVLKNKIFGKKSRHFLMFMMSDLKNSFIFSIELVCIVRFYLILKNTCRGQHYTHQCTGCRALWKEEDFFFFFFSVALFGVFSRKEASKYDGNRSDLWWGNDQIQTAVGWVSKYNLMLPTFRFWIKYIVNIRTAFRG